MSVNILFGTSDSELNQIVTVLKKYQADFPDAQIDLYRQNSASVRVRIVNTGFERMNKRERHDSVWNYLKPLDEDIRHDINMLVLLTPDELKKSFANFEFNDPVPSKL